MQWPIKVSSPRKQIKLMIYLDHAATTPMSKMARDAYQKVAENFFGNPSSLHDTGSEAERVLESSRKVIADAAEAEARGLFFTGSGTEANFLAIVSLCMAHRKKGNHIITTAVEHSSVANTFSWLETQGFEITRLGVDGRGRIITGELRDAIRPDTILASVQHANSETGTLQDLEKIGTILKENEVLFHSDCVQSFCKLPFEIKKWKLDSFSVSAHKVHGPKGIGGVWIRPGVNWQPFYPEASQENRFRPGTVDVPSAASFAAAVNEFAAKREDYSQKMESLNSCLIENLSELTNIALFFEGDPKNKLSNIVGIRLKNMEGQYAMLECSQQGVGISTGSACRANDQKPSASLIAMGRSNEEARQFIRISFGMMNSETEIDRASDVLINVIKKHTMLVKA